MRSFAHLGGRDGTEKRSLARGGRCGHPEGGAGHNVEALEQWEGENRAVWLRQRGERLGRDKMTTGATGTWKGVVEIIVEKIGKRWNKMEKYS